MRGTKKIIISNRFAKFEFELHRNITIIRGDSGTGKTTLFNMVADYTRNKEHSGINLSSPCPCVALIDQNWEAQLQDIHESVVFIDEDSNNNYLNTKDFSRAVQNSDNYYVLFTREDLHELPYSIDEIYEIKMSGKYHRLKKLYKSKFINGYYYRKNGLESIDVIITEDEKSGFQFFQAAFEKSGIECVAAGGNSNIYRLIKGDENKKFIVIADGAAFGAEIDRILKLEKSGYNICIYLPESFEWVILKSGLINGVEDVLDNPSEHIESKNYFSWERYFTEFLIEKTRDGYLAYRKANLNRNYLNENERNAIIKVLPDFKK